MKLIEADKVKRAIKDYWKAQVDKALTLTDGNKKRIDIYLEHNHDLLKAIDKLPSVKPEIIRCKDCAYCDSDVVDAPYGMTKKIFWCDRLYAGANENLIVEPDNFCSWAERREDATD